MRNAVAVSGNGTARVRDGSVMGHLVLATTPAVKTALYNATVIIVFAISIKSKYPYLDTFKIRKLKTQKYNNYRVTIQRSLFSGPYQIRKIISEDT